MNAFVEKGILYFPVKKNDGSIRRMSLREIVTLKDWPVLVDMMLKYSSGKAYKSVTTWGSRVICTLTDVIVTSEMTQLPKSSKEWQMFIKNWYGITLTTNNLKSSVETRVAAWNKLIRPFLVFMQQRDIIPCDVLIPSMKAVGERNKNSSFKVSLIGESEPIISSKASHIDKLLAPVSLSRSDAEYLDELQYDLERKRNKLYECLAAYWKAIKTNYEHGKKLIASVDVNEVERRLNDSDYKNIVSRPDKPPLNYHFSSVRTKDGLANFLYLVQKSHGNFSPKKTRLSCLPGITAFYTGMNDINLFPDVCVENPSEITRIDQLKWALGNLNYRDVSYISALLIMLNPSFNPEALFDCNIKDKDGKLWLESGDGQVQFSVEKKRAKTRKREALDDLSYEIISTIIEMTEKNRNRVKYPEIRNRLFIVPGRCSSSYVLPAPQRLVKWITGSTDNKSPHKELSLLFPSLEEYGLKYTVSHSKIRATEGVLEWLRTGSVRAVSKKLGNSKKVSLRHYIPDALVAAYNTRLIRRFQNTLIIAATKNEDYLLEAVDFNSLNEVHNFIVDLLATHEGSKNPLIEYLKEYSSAKSDDTQMNSSPFGELISSISEKSLGALYLYQSAALKSNIKGEVLARIDNDSGISPLALITLSSYLNRVLPDHSNAEIRDAHKNAILLASKLQEKTNWSKLLLRKSVLA